jgi:cytochrome P450
MPAQPVGKPAKKAPFYRVVAGLVRDPISAFEEVGQRSGGDIVRINLGLFRPYLVTRPEHVQHVLRDNNTNYVRDGMFWKPLRRLLGNGILGYGTRWQASRKTIQPLFTAKHIDSLMTGLTSAILDAVDGFKHVAQPGQPIDATVEMTRVVHRAVSRVLFGDRIARADFDRLAPAIDTAANSVIARLLLPFAPLRMPMPGDRAFRRSVRTIEDVMMPLIRQAREQSLVEGDIVSTLCHTRTPDGRALTDAEVRDDVVAMFAAGTETTAVTMAWFWVALTDNPDVAERLCAEVDRVVGEGPVQPSHLPQLRYTKMVLQELLRLYSSGWIVPRRAAKDDIIDGVRIPAGATVLLSPYLTHRMAWTWDSPHTFDPERFAPEREAKRHRYAYFPFGGGPHQCIGQHFFTAEAQIIIAAMLSRYRPLVLNESAVTPKPAASLRPRQRIDMLLRPRPTS